MTPNNEWKKAGLAVCAAAGFFLICIIAFASIDGFDGGFALLFISFFLAAGSLAVALLYIHRARVMDSILADPELLAHWSYTEEIAEKSMEREYHEFQERNRAMFFVIGGMLVVVALFFILFIEEGGPETGIVLLLIAVLLFIVSRITPWLERRRVKTAPNEALISRSGIVYRGTVYPFRSFMMAQDSVAFQAATRKRPARVVFSFTLLVGYIVRPFDIAVPVPPGMEDDAHRVVRELGGSGAD